MSSLIKWFFGFVLIGIILLAGFGIYLTTLNPDPIERPERQMSEVWDGYPFQSHYIRVKGSNMHYIDEGNSDGPIFLFLHGNPTSSYLWRDVVGPVAASGARVIAVDNIGFGASDRPDIAYTFVDHAAYIEGFIDAMELKNVTLVIHDWGSALGFDYAFRHQENINAIVFMEAMTRGPVLDELSPMIQQVFKLIRTDGVGDIMILGGNLFIENLLPTNVIRKLTDSEMDAYREPFPTLGSRLPLLAWPRQIPFGGKPVEVAVRIDQYAKWLPSSSLPKLLLYFDPGVIITKPVAEEMARDWENLDAQFLGEGTHFVQEDHGAEIGNAIVSWYQEKIPV